MTDTDKPCVTDGCDFPRVKGCRYCTHCERRVMLELRSTGYLTPRPWWTPFRPMTARENVLETKNGVDDRADRGYE